METTYIRDVNTITKVVVFSLYIYCQISRLTTTKKTAACEQTCNSEEAFFHFFQASMLLHVNKYGEGFH